ncbi:hypothetical protein ACFVWR_00670 [Leifsonia sp. NPDC058292]|uniref:hypothetical protein n=1 Tax=Leifsonia sp. NPDC058292 TaxID=3346428 RepID=UPI0036DD5B6A
MLAKLQLSSRLETELDDFDDDDASVGVHAEGGSGEVGYSWLNGRRYGEAEQSGRYCFITHSESIAALKTGYRFDRHDIALADVDSGLLKDARDRVLTRSIAHWVYDLRDHDRNELVNGIEFHSRHGDEIRMWAVFERSDDERRSGHIDPQGKSQRVTREADDLIPAGAAS